MANRILFIALFLLGGFFLSAQDTSAPEMAETFYKEGKIYLVIGVVSMVVVGMLLYLFLLDRKVSKIEKKLSNEQRDTSRG